MNEGEKQRGKRGSILRFWPRPPRAQRRLCVAGTRLRNGPDLATIKGISRIFFDTLSTPATQLDLIGTIRIMLCAVFLSVLGIAQASVYLPQLKEEQLLADDTLLRELINQIGSELADVVDSYLTYQDKPKEIPVELPVDYDGIDTLNPNPSIRDQEYLRHSTLWSHQRVNDNDKINDRHKVKANLKNLKDEKAENTLPAYCTPPNPCPVGYTSENNCLIEFENTAAFSRDYQSAQDCMCDTEHMLGCPNDSVNENSLQNMHLGNSNFDQIVEQFQEENPFFYGEKLPIAAKKGINVIY